jgi:hypothetical protein
MKMKNVLIPSKLIVTINENLIIFMIGSVIHKWLNNMWCLVQFELVTYVHVLMAN